jgi:hypothetical protein
LSALVVPDSVHTVLVAALMYGISQEKFEFTTEAALVPFNMQELRCCRTWKVYVTGTRRTSHRRRSYGVLKRDESHVRYESGWERPFLAVSKANTVVDGIKEVIGIDDSWWSTIISNICLALGGITALMTVKRNSLIVIANN